MQRETANLSQKERSLCLVDAKEIGEKSFDSMGIAASFLVSFIAEQTCIMVFF
jgi:hypothetical protein